MSLGGGGLCFLIRVPTEEHENDIFISRSLSRLSDVPSTNSIPSIFITPEAADNTIAKTRVPDPLEQVLRKSLEHLRIHDATWILDKEESFYQVSFTCCPGLPCDLVLADLSANGIGLSRGSSLVILPCTVWLQEDETSLQDGRDSEQKIQFLCEEKKSESDFSTLSKTKSEVKNAFKNFKEMKRKFLQTVTARLTVAQVVDGVRAGAEPTFDFIMFVLIASMIAALGLLEDSSVIIVASMLISPIMGPIMAGSFGACIRDKSLRNLGIRTEIFGLLICIIIGFIFGVTSELLKTVWGSKQWPNPEMVSRGQERSLWVGVLIALPSGAGVALSLLGGNAGCLVGVAISASLLPPAVNAGLLWGMAVVRSVRAQDEEYEYTRIGGVLRLYKPSLAPPPGYETNYYADMDKECAVLGLVSLTLAFVNIICIFVSALIVLKVKEVAPNTSKAKTSRFWKEDLKIARDYNATMPANEADELGKQFIAEWATLNGLEPDALLSEDDAEAAVTRMETLKSLMQDVESDEVFQSVARSVSICNIPRPVSQRISVASVPGNLNVQDGTTGLKEMIRERSKSLRPPDTSASPEGELDPALRDVELRRPQVHVSPRLSQRHSMQHRGSVAALRHSLMHSENPYTLWPSEPRPSIAPRFMVTPVPEESVAAQSPLLSVRRRVSKFLTDPCLIVKETTC